MNYVGVISDKMLIFDNHIEFIRSKSVKKLGIIRKARDFLDRKTSVLLCESLVLPHLDYCDIVYGCTSAAN